MIAFAFVLALSLSAQPTAEAAYESTAGSVDRGNDALRKGEWIEAIHAYDQAEFAAKDLEGDALRTRVRFAIAENRARAALGLARSEPGDRASAVLRAVSKELAALDLEAAPEPTAQRLTQVKRDVEAQLAKQNASMQTPLQRRLVIAGIVVSASAALGVAVMAAGFALGAQAEDEYIAGPTRAERDAADAKGSRGNSMAFGGGLSAGVLLSAGAALLVLGRRVDKQGHEAPTARIGPTGVSVRF